MKDLSPMTNRASSPELPKNKSHSWMIVLALLMLATTGVVLWRFMSKPDESQPALKPSQSVSVSVSTPIESNLTLPPIDLPQDAGTTIQDSGQPTQKNNKVANATENCGSCSGSITPELQAAVQSRGATAKQCYQSALQGNESLSGEISLEVKIGADGSTCSVSIRSDTVGSSRLQQCVRSKMYGNYPKPNNGCVTFGLPIQFKPQQR